MAGFIYATLEWYRGSTGIEVHLFRDLEQARQEFFREARLVVNDVDPREDPERYIENIVELKRLRANRYGAECLVESDDYTLELVSIDLENPLAFERLVKQPIDCGEWIDQIPEPHHIPEDDDPADY